MLRWFRSRPSETGPPPETAAPPGARLYAIGDVHGRLDLLTRLHAQIAADAATAPPRRVILHLGDLIDRGPESRGVIDLLLNRPLPGFEHVHLLGNHEAALLSFLDDPEAGPDWLYYGGAATLAAYGVAASPYERDPARMAELRAALAAALPAAHLELLRGMPLSHVEGDYLFVHAGLRPGLPLAEQASHDLLWIRREFLDCVEPFEKIVVHGHSISEEVETRCNRIGIDTGAFYTNRLTCLVLEGGERRLLQT